MILCWTRKSEIQGLRDIFLSFTLLLFSIAAMMVLALLLPNPSTEEWKDVGILALILLLVCVGVYHRRDEEDGVAEEEI